MLKFGYETVAYGAETLVFVFLGMGLFAFDHPYEQLSFGFVVGTMLNFNIARFVNVTVCSWIVNRQRSSNKLNRNM